MKKMAESTRDFLIALFGKMTEAGYSLSLHNGRMNGERLYKATSPGTVFCLLGSSQHDFISIHNDQGYRFQSMEIDYDELPDCDLTLRMEFYFYLNVDPVLLARRINFEWE